MAKIFNEDKKNVENETVNASTTSTATAIENNTQWVQYKKSTGHGHSAEDANTLKDKLCGKKVENTGRTNEKNGPDRVVVDRNGNVLQIQTKYCNSAKNTVNAAFDNETGKYRYKNQVIEVPKDQYEEAIKEMAQKIKDGKVPGVTNPDDAKKIIKKGDITYQQAKNITKAGNIDSLWFDIKSQAVGSVSAFGITFVITYANCIWSDSDMDIKDALKLSAISGLKSGGIVLGVGVITQQFLRTASGRSFAAFASSISKRLIDSIYKSEIGKKAIEKLAVSILGKQLFGVTAKNAVIKLLRTDIITTVITTTVMTIPDFWKALIEKKISWGQFYQNLTINVSSVGAGTIGTIGGTILGGMAGAAIESIIENKKPGSSTPSSNDNSNKKGSMGTIIGGKIGGVIGGAASSIGTAIAMKEIFKYIRKDDAKIMHEVAVEAIVQLAIDCMITEDEYKSIENEIDKMISIKWLEKMYQSGNSKSQRYHFAYDQLEPIFINILSTREEIIILKDKEIRKIFSRTYFILFIEYIKDLFRKLFRKNTIIEQENNKNEKINNYQVKYENNKENKNYEDYITPKKKWGVINEK